MKNIFENLGLFFPNLEVEKVRYPKYEYQKKASREHLQYLKELLEFQRDRQSTIENKTSQLVGQSSVVFSLVGLFVPIFYDKFLTSPLVARILLVLIFLIAFLFYLFTIIHSTRTLLINRYTYATGDTKTVLSNLSIKEFIEEQVKDLIFSIQVNSYSNDLKGTNLILAHRTFSIGNGAFAILALSVCMSLLFLDKSPTAEERQAEALEKTLRIQMEIKDYIRNLHYHDSTNCSCLKDSLLQAQAHRRSLKN